MADKPKELPMVHVPPPRLSSEKPEKLPEAVFTQRFLEPFADPRFADESAALKRLAAIAFKNYSEGRKAPVTRKAGPGYKNPDYELSQTWIDAKAAIDQAQKDFEQAEKPRILLINGSDRNEATCPGERSKSSRLIDIAKKQLGSAVDVEVLDLSLITAEYGKTIHPCKGCVSTAMPLCHWPCSCYPHHSLGQVHDWMNEIYPMWVRAHGVMIITPVYWLQAPSGLKLLIDRLVCADGGNTDPTSTDGKDVKKAKSLELHDWDYPRHLKNRIFSVIVHGDVEGADRLKVSLVDWLSGMELIPAAPINSLARYIGYFEPYATSHEALDRDEAMQKEVQNAAVALMQSVVALRNQQMEPWKLELENPRPK